MGGLARKATIINESIRSGDPHFILDAGDLLFKKNKISPGISVDLAKVNAETIIEAFNIIGCDGFNVGENDLALGLDYLINLKNNSTFPYLSANIKNKNGAFLFKPYNIITKNNIKMGIIGLSSVFDSDEVIVDDPFESLDKIISFVDENVDIIVLLFNAKDQDIVKYHQSNYPIDFILQSKSKRRSSDGGKKSTPVYSCGSRGKYLYEFEFAYKDLNNPFVDIALHESTKSLLERKINRLEKRLEQSSENNVIISDIEELRIKIENENKIIAEAQNIIVMNQIPLDKKIIDRGDIIKIIDESIIRRNEFGVPPEEDHHHHHHNHDHHNHGH